MTKLNKKDKALIYELSHDYGRSQKDIAIFMKVSQSTVSKIINDDSNSNSIRFLFTKNEDKRD